MVPEYITDLAREVDQAAKDLAARTITITEYDVIANRFDRAVEQWKADRAQAEEPAELRAGDVVSTGRGIELVTPRGRLVLTIPEALTTAMMLIGAAHGDLTSPWSGDDESTILTRGTRTIQEA